ncbi:MAG: class I SAM-dependent methyltransferase [Dissulfurimicrobium sp.]|uniref:class I SAM-dependent methyltransferase n=1 Tax=Dissulfurimicrobium sp. TaxID=2022436 RepID=UPI004049C3E7
MASKGSDIFDEIAGEYDLWYEGNVIFLNELAALKLAVSSYCPSHGKHHDQDLSLEIGVGSGRFASALSIGFGIDPAIEPLKIALSRNICVVQASAEAIPFKPCTFDSVFFVTSLCFIDDHILAMNEAARVIKNGGWLVLGFIPLESQWGVFYQKKKEEGHKVYRYARFFRSDELISLATKEGFLFKGAVSTLFQPPDIKKYISEVPEYGMIKKGGFQVLVFKKEVAFERYCPTDGPAKNK